MRISTFTLRKPVPTGVVMGPLMATLFLRIESRTCVGQRRAVLLHDVGARLDGLPLDVDAGRVDDTSSSPR